ncbi:MAG: zinc-ribbon domain-containing protein, partial [Chloroflexi bacterium]|nr:zinc-ribbon domain-containing protein [Chloroflexota bacterium]
MGLIFCSKIWRIIKKFWRQSDNKGADLAHKFPCPKCGAEIPVGQAYCTSCGERFEYKAPGEVQISQPPPVMPPQPIMVPPHGHHRHGF